MHNFVQFLQIFFFNNCRKNGILAVVLQAEEVQALFKEVEANEGCLLTVDLLQQTVCSPGGNKFSFEIDSFAKNCLLEVWMILAGPCSLKTKFKITNKKPGIGNPGCY